MRYFSRWRRCRGYVAASGVFASGIALAGCHGGHHRRELSEKELREEMKSHTEDVLERVDASKAQVQSIQGIVDGLVPDMMVLRADKQRLKDAFQKALSSDTVDRQELERIRKEAVAMFDRASLRFMDAASQSSAVLTPAQRRDLLAKWKRFSR